MCFFLAVETYMKYYQQAAKSHKAITFQGLSQGGTTFSRIPPRVGIPPPFADFMQLLSCCFNKNKMIVLVSVCKRKGQAQKTQL